MNIKEKLGYIFEYFWLWDFISINLSKWVSLGKYSAQEKKGKKPRPLRRRSSASGRQKKCCQKSQTFWRRKLRVKSQQPENMELKTKEVTFIWQLLSHWNIDVWNRRRSHRVNPLVALRLRPLSPLNPSGLPPVGVKTFHVSSTGQLSSLLVVLFGNIKA